MAKNKTLKIYNIPKSLEKLKLCKTLSDNGILNFKNTNNAMSYQEWLVIIAFINIAGVEKKQKYYHEFNNGEFLI